jgi:cAMP-dependent protein kinase regulator
VAGRVEDVMRGCVAVLEHDDSQIGAVALLARAAAGGRPEVAGRAAERLVEAFVRRGDLPRALAAADSAKRAGRDPAPLRALIAKAFGRGSRRVGDVAPSPPPLPPKETTISKELASAKGEALLAHAEEALSAFLAREDDAPADAKVPRLPLFGSLSPAALEQLLEAWEVRDLPAGHKVVEEGAEGRDAFVVVRGALRAERQSGEETLVLALLGPGALFGEMALVSDAPRAASVIAEEPAQLLVASRAALEELAKRTPQIGQQLGEFCRARMISNLVRHSAVLRAVAPADREPLMARFESCSFKAQERLVTLGSESQGLFLLASGGVRVVGRDADGDDLEVAVLGPGDVVGEISLVLRRPATADVIATHPTIALSLRREQFQEAIKQHPTLLGELYDLATKREEEMRTVVAQEALDVEEVLL